MDIQLNTDTWDVLIVNNDLGVVTGVDAIIQNVRQRLQFFFGEFFLNQSIGIPWIQLIFTKNVSRELVDSILKAEIIKTPGIERLRQFSMDVDAVTRKLNVAFVADATEGLVNYNESFIIAA